MFPFYTPWKQQKTKGFLLFSGGIKWEHWLGTGWNNSSGASGIAVLPRDMGYEMYFQGV